MTTIQDNPVVSAASLGALISAFVILLRSLGWLPMTDDQYNALMGFVVLAIPVGLSFWARSKVTPVNNPKDNEGRELVAREYPE